MTLDEERIEEIFNDCLIRESFWGPIFYKTKIEMYREEIELLVNELPKEFTITKAYVDKTGRLWTCYHESVERLLQLGIAVKAIKEYRLTLWEWLFNSLPHYYVIPRADYL